jgi:hypothetical protein
MHKEYCSGNLLREEHTEIGTNMKGNIETNSREMGCEGTRVINQGNL